MSWVSLFHVADVQVSKQRCLMPHSGPITDAVLLTSRVQYTASQSTTSTANFQNILVTCSQDGTARFWNLGNASTVQEGGVPSSHLPTSVNYARHASTLRGMLSVHSHALDGLGGPAAAASAGVRCIEQLPVGGGTASDDPVVGLMCLRLSPDNRHLAIGG